MIKRFLILFIVLFYFTSANPTNFKEAISISKIDGKEDLAISETPLSDKKQITKLKVDINENKKYLNYIRPRLLNKNKNRSVVKYKGPSKEIFKEYAKSVVFIGNYKKNGSGSGFVIDHEGKKVITNWHVIEGAKNVRIWIKPNRLDEQYMLDNLESYNAKVIKIDKVKDLALLEVTGLPNDIKPVSFGNYNDITIGEIAYAIGHPGDLIWSYNNGMVSQVRPNYKWTYKNSRHSANVIQIQVPINPGNSGGPLFNDKKELIGVNTFTTDGENLNFAISVNDVIDFLKKPERKIKENKYIQKKKKGPTWITKSKKKGPNWITKKDKKSKKNHTDKKYPNAEKGDYNNNGITDIWLIDENENGKWDKAIIDQNEDGIIEKVAYDENEDGNFEIFLYDDDLDGNADRAEIDTDENGTSDIRAYDKDQDGKWDKYEKI